VLQVLLQSPHFLYRSEVGVPGPSGDFQLTGTETATAMSYLLWGTTPDDALLDAAEAGELLTPESREAHARRMLDDPRARAQGSQVVLQWLGVESLPVAVRSDALYPGWDAALAEAMLEESRRFVEHAAFDGGGFGDLLLSRDSFADARLAALYGLDAPAGDGFAPVTLPPERAGLLGQAAWLTDTSHSDQSSPIRRGLFVRESLLCQTFPAPPADAGGVPDVDTSATTRERFAQHTSEPRCAACHDLIDPIGFGFETFDAIGAWRTTEYGQPIDATGWVEDLEGEGSQARLDFATQPELMAHLARSESATRCFATQWLRYASGRLETDARQCAVERAHDWFAQSDGSLVELLVAIAQSDDFVRRSP
jgi:hypothetical protein